MNEFNRVGSRFLVLLGLMVGLALPLAVQAAPRLVLQLSLVEYSYPVGRLGTLKLYVPDGPSPFAGDPDFRGYDTGLWAVTDWGTVGNCNASYLAGGHQEGWLLGPVTDLSTVRALHPSATALFGVVTGMFGDTSQAWRYACPTGSIPETWSILYIFLLPKATFVQGQGYHVGDVLYATDYYASGNWYYLYSSTAP